jgi:NAD(P)-dependent dehydrogenase (short-subunit alcohol dehydrogenase family)
MFDFSNKTALVTGGSGGMGRAIVEAFCRAGGRVIIADIDREQSEELAGAVGNGSFALRLDVSRIETIEGEIRAAAERAGRIDLLVNNAGIFDMMSVLDVTPQSFDRLFGVNVRGFFFVMQSVARLMAADGQGGSIVNIASQAGRRGDPFCSIYAATKATVISLTQSAALALIGQNIRVNAVAPGVIDTQMWDSVDALFAKQFNLPVGEKKRQVGLSVPLGRMGRAEEIARAVMFLASSEAEYVVGQTLNVDGGNFPS